MPNKKSNSPTKFVYNILIVVLAIVIVGFIYSFAQKNFSNGVTLQNHQLTANQKTQLAIDLYEENPILDITVEVLNGCGEKGIATKIADFLRTEHIDVVRSENADNFDYEKTMLIQRSYDFSNLKTVASALDFDVNNEDQVITQPSSTADVDLTLIIGKDYRSIKPIKVYLANLQ
ncbi:LytR C-terminal domain-containing protein [bacterium]|nr:LytR C-terminal domain-containing protein [bacterium]